MAVLIVALSLITHYGLRVTTQKKREEIETDADSKREQDGGAGA